MFFYFNRAKLLNTFQTSETVAVYGFALQPGANENLVAAAYGDGILRLFYTRRSKPEDYTDLINTNAE